MTTEAGPGHNIAPDNAKLETERLTADYAELARSVADALGEARRLPAEVADEDTQSTYAAVIKRLRDLATRVEGIRELEKEPHLRRGNAVDSFFGALRAKLTAKNKTDAPGAVDVLQKRVNAYVQKKADEERRRREEAERAARAEEARIRNERIAAERAAAEEAARAERARKPENKEAAADAAAAAAAEAERLRDEEDRARQSRQDATIEATAKTADLVRTRTDSGHLVTAKQVPYVEIVDAMKLDPAVLWAFVKDDAKLAALKSWAKTTQYKKPMAGAIIEMRDEAVIR